MASGNLKIVSFNVNGLLNPIKCSKVLAKMKKEQAHIVYLQETHLNNTEHEKLQRMGFTYLFFSSYISRHRRGVAILISNKLHFEKTFEIKDTEGRFILVRGKIDGNPVTLLNVYAPPGSDISFFQKITTIMVTETRGLLICGGDLNIHLKPELDSSNRKTHDTKSLYKKVKILFEEVGLIDVWREVFPNRRDYTYYSAPQSSYTRIDYFLTFGKDKDKIHSCGTGILDLSNHAPIYLAVNLNITWNTTWKLNSSLLNDPSFKEEIRKEINLYLEIIDNEDVCPLILWDALKAVLKGENYSSSFTQEKTKK